MSKASNTPSVPLSEDVRTLQDVLSRYAQNLPYEGHNHALAACDRLEAHIAELEGALREIRDELIMDYEGAGRDAHAIASAALFADPLHPPDPVVREALEQEC